MKTIRTKAGRFFVSLLPSVVLLLSGCSASTPTPGDGEAFVQNKVAKESEGRLKLAGFNKTDGLKSEMAGIQMYTMEYAGQIQVLEDCKWVSRPFEPPGFATVKPPAETGGGFSWEKFRDSADNPGVLAKKGQRIPIAGRIAFSKSERGWRVNELTVVITGQASTAGPQVATPAVTEKAAISQSTEQKDPKKTLAACIKNLQGIEGAKEQWAAENKKTDGATTTGAESAINAFLKVVPVCPDGGTYTYGVIGSEAKCSIPGHSFGAAATDSSLAVSESKEIVAARTAITSFETALRSFEVDNGYHPRGKNGLQDLIQRPKNAQDWRGPYLRSLQNDPWGNPYQYRNPGIHNRDSYDLWSMGADGKDGGEKENADIGNWSDSPASSTTQQVGIAKANISQLESALERFNIHSDRFPTTQEGLAALEKAPPSIERRWRGPYVPSLRKDPWGNPYQYRNPGVHNPKGFDIWSRGADGKDGGEKEDADIGNWDSSNQSDSSGTKLQTETANVQSQTTATSINDSNHDLEKYFPAPRVGSRLYSAQYTRPNLKVQEGTILVAISSSKEVNGKSYLREMTIPLRLAGVPHRTQFLRSDTNGIFTIDGKDATSTEFLSVPFPLQFGQSWTEKRPKADQTGTEDTTYKIESLETLQVSDRAFNNCLKVSFKGSNEDGILYMAPEIGVIKGITKTGEATLEYALKPF